MHLSHVKHALTADWQDAGVSAGGAAGATGGRSRQAAHLICAHHPGRLQVTHLNQLLTANSPLLMPAKMMATTLEAYRMNVSETLRIKKMMSLEVSPSHPPELRVVMSCSVSW